MTNRTERLDIIRQAIILGLVMPWDVSRLLETDFHMTGLQAAVWLSRVVKEQISARHRKEMVACPC
jgi:hypothetical protein